MMDSTGHEQVVAPTDDLEQAVGLLARHPAAAKASAQDVLKTAPRHVKARLILGSALRRTRDLKGAREVLTELTRSQPSLAAAQYELGLALSQLGDGERAAAAFHKAAFLQPTMVEAWQGLGDLQLAEFAAALGQDRPSAILAELTARLAPRLDEVAVMRMLAEADLRFGRHVEAEARLVRCLKLSPTLPGVRQALAAVLIHRQKGADALVQIERLLKGEPANPHFRNLKAVALGLMGEEARSIRAYEAVLAARPDLPKVWLSYGHALKTAGRRNDSVAAYRRAIALSPRFGQAYWSLANLKLIGFADEDVAAMLAVLQDPRASEDDRIHLHYAVGKALEDRAEYKDAFEHYSQGARLKQARAPYDAAAMTAQIARTKAFFTSEMFERRRGEGFEAEDPIFVVGLPRSGSTLVEQILSSHPLVEGTRELVEIAAIVNSLDYGKNATDKVGYPTILDDLSRQDLHALGHRYLTSAGVHRKTDRPFFIDKTPSNFLHIGLIHLILPKAKIIDVRRHPLASCVSGFKQHFAHGHAFSYDLNGIGRYYSDYVALMDHFDNVLPQRVCRIVYEDLIEDTEAQVRRMLQYCGLEFEPACLRFYENDRPVRTPSSEQVRRPISRENADQWRNFEPWLDPLKTTLGESIDKFPSYRYGSKIL